MKGQYPKPSSIARQITHEGTSLQGARRFYAAAGVVAYAYDRGGMANVARRVWLPPSATRRLSTYLDMVTAAVGGLIMQPAGMQAPQLDVGGATTASGRLRELAEAAEGRPIGSSRQTLCAIDEPENSDWEWSGTLRYDHTYRLRSGEYTTSRPPVTFHVRTDPESHDRAHIVVEIRRQDDYRQVQRWISALLPLDEKWAAVPLTFVNGTERHAEIRSVADAIGGGDEILVAHGKTERSSQAPTGDVPIGEFEQNMKEGNYKTAMHSLDALVGRAENVDHAVITAFDLYHWRGPTRRRVAVRVRVKQHGTAPLTIEWGAVREPLTQGGVPLPGPVRLHMWDDMTSVIWPEDRRIAHLRSLWNQLIGAQQRATQALAA